LIEGGIASGKSTVSKLLSEKYNFTIIDADAIAAGALEPGEEPYKQIIHYFDTEYANVIKDSTANSNCILLPLEEEPAQQQQQQQPQPQQQKQKDRKIDRAALGKIVFAHPQVRKAVNSATHTYIFKKICSAIYQNSESGALLDLWVPSLIKGLWQSQESKQNEKIVILDAPLLFETSILSYMTVKNTLVYCNEDTQIERLMKRNNYTREEALQRQKVQMPLEEKKKLANYTIDNNGDLKHLEQQVAAFVEYVRKL